MFLIPLKEVLEESNGRVYRIEQNFLPEKDGCLTHQHLNHNGYRFEVEFNLVMIYIGVLEFWNWNRNKIFLNDS